LAGRMKMADHDQQCYTERFAFYREVTSPDEMLDSARVTLLRPVPVFHFHLSDECPFDSGSIFFETLNLPNLLRADEARYGHHSLERHRVQRTQLIVNCHRFNKVAARGLRRWREPTRSFFQECARQ
jgi:hypothetical protein